VSAEEGASHRVWEKKAGNPGHGSSVSAECHSFK
jgi:hypothetical protein